MSLRLRLALIFLGMLVICLIATTYLSYQELIEEPLDAQTAAEHEQESLAWQLAEVAGRGSIPIILLAAGAWFLVHRMLRPITGLTEAAQRISTGRMEELGHPLPLTGRGDELDRLTIAFNQMSDRLRESFAQIHHFTLHASHELKTPLTVLRASVERELTNSPISTPHADVLATRLDEIGRMTKIVDGLSMLTRADADLLKLTLEPVALHVLVREVADDLEALADGLHLQITIHPCEEITLSADRHRLRQLLLILGDNAVKYNQPHGSIRLQLEVAVGMAIFTITNTGPLVDEPVAARVFDRFYRGDHSAGRTVDGCGLGLSIARSLVELHHGQIEFISNAAGNTVRVELPRRMSASEDVAAGLI